MKQQRYVALLRGINVGKKIVKMAQLRNLLESIGFEHVKTLLNSGNAIFDSTEKSVEALTKTLESAFKTEFGFPIDTFIRTMDEIVLLVESDPFKGITVTPQTRLYVTFLSEEPKEKLELPYISPNNDYQILKVAHNAVISVLTLSLTSKTVEAMDILGKIYGKRITTRNWNTVRRIYMLR